MHSLDFNFLPYSFASDSDPFVSGRPTMARIETDEILRIAKNLEKIAKSDKPVGVPVASEVDLCVNRMTTHLPCFENCKNARSLLINCRCVYGSHNITRLTCRLHALVPCSMNFENRRRMKNVPRLPSRSLNIGKSIRSPMLAAIRRRTFRLKSQTPHNSSALPATPASARRL